MFGFLKNTVSRIYTAFTSKLSALFGRAEVDAAWLKELEGLLLQADTGIKTTNTLIQQLKGELERRGVLSGEEAYRIVHDQLVLQLDQLQRNRSLEQPTVLLMVGVNGSGKTTFLGKLAHKLNQEGKRVLLVAADTFRAAAPQQLAAWAEKTGATIHCGRPEQDPSSVIFDGCTRFVAESFDYLLIDTAGRLQTKIPLMQELAKMRRIISKQLPQMPIHTWLSVDAMIGQNSLPQAELFNDATELNGLVLTKYDSTGKGGMLFAITDRLQLPVQYVTFGESLEALQPFKPEEFVQTLLQR